MLGVFLGITSFIIIFCLSEYCGRNDDNQLIEENSDNYFY